MTKTSSKYTMFGFSFEVLEVFAVRKKNRKDLQDLEESPCL